MTRYQIEVLHQGVYYNCQGPSFDTMIGAMLWAWDVYPRYSFRAVPIKFAS